MKEDERKQRLLEHVRTIICISTERGGGGGADSMSSRAFVASVYDTWINITKLRHLVRGVYVWLIVPRMSAYRNHRRDSSTQQVRFSSLHPARCRPDHQHVQFHRPVHLPQPRVMRVITSSVRLAITVTPVRDDTAELLGIDTRSNCNSRS